MSRIKTITLSGVTADDNGIVVSVTPAAGGEQALTIAGQPPQPILIDIDCTGDETGRTFTIVGTDRFGEVISEAVTGASGGVAQSTKQFATITSITVDDDTAGAIIVGWAAVVYSAWFPLNTYPEQFDVTANIVVTGTVNFDLEYTFGDVFPKNTNGGDLEATLPVVVDGDIDGDTASITKILTYRAQAIRLKLNSGTGSLLATVAQAGNR